MSDAKIYSINVESTITIFEASFTLIQEVYSTGITYDKHQLTILMCLKCRPLEFVFLELSHIAL